jgi:hypothetical protein
MTGKPPPSTSLVATAVPVATTAFLPSATSKPGAVTTYTPTTASRTSGGATIIVVRSRRRTSSVAAAVLATRPIRVMMPRLVVPMEST